MSADEKSKIVRSLFGLNYFLTPEAISAIPDFDFEFFLQNVLPNIKQNEKPLSFGKEQVAELFYSAKGACAKQTSTADAEIPHAPAASEASAAQASAPLVIGLGEKAEDVQVIKSYAKESKKREVQHFVSYFRARFESLRKLLQNRPDLLDAVSIRRISGGREKAAVIGLVLDKGETKNGNVALTLEDLTGTIKVIISKDKPDMISFARDEITLDEVIGVVGNANGDVIFANSILLPEIPTKEFKKAPDNVYAAFTSDLHVGSKMFLPDELLRFIKWINGEAGSEEQKKIAKAVKYLFVVGDLVDGVGIYPNQESEIEIKDIIEQYNECARYLSMIRKDISIIICPGNHDAGRISEPQLALDKRYAAAIYALPNATIISNPSAVRIHTKNGFPGFNVLLYHGYGFDYYIANVSTIRNNGGYDRADLMMKYLLQKRHLAPTHASMMYIPDEEEDPLVIDTVPDFFVTGHIHKVAVANYKSTTMICCSCWQDKTSFQEKVGHNPEPGRVPIVNLKTREVKIMRFDC